MARPNPSEYAPYYHTYVGKVPEGTIPNLLIQTFQDFKAFISKIDESKADYSYAEGKWTVKEALQHIIDTERVMAYRALRVARKDKTELPGYDQDDFAAVANVSHRTMADLMDEFSFVRQSSIALFQSFSEEDLVQLGTASNSPVSTRSLGYIILGHLIHHKSIFEGRYFQSNQ